METQGQKTQEITEQQRVLNQLDDITDAYYHSANPIALTIYSLEIRSLLIRAAQLGVVINYFGETFRG